MRHGLILLQFNKVFKLDNFTTFAEGAEPEIFKITLIFYKEAYPHISCD
jgi:hypothetical protein